MTNNNQGQHVPPLPGLEPDELPADLIGLSEACRLIPGSVPGKRLNAATLFRWVAKGKLRGWRIGGRTVVSRSEVLSMFRPVPRASEAPRLIPTRRQEEATERWVHEELRAAGLE